MSDSIPAPSGTWAFPAQADLGRGKIFPFLEYRAVRLEPAVAMEMGPRPEVDLEEPEHALAVPAHELPPRRLEVARPCLQGEVVAVPVVVEGDGLQRGPVGGGEELGEHHRSVIAGEDVAIGEGAHVELLPPRREVHVHASARLEKHVEPLEEGGIVGQVLHDPTEHDGVVPLARRIGEDALVGHAQPGGQGVGGAPLGEVGELLARDGQHGHVRPARGGVAREGPPASPRRGRGGPGRAGRCPSRSRACSGPPARGVSSSAV